MSHEEARANERKVPEGGYATSEKQRDPRIEALLEREGVAWHYEPNVPLSKVDKAASLNNQARFRPLNPDHVIELAMAAEEGQLPAMIAYYDRQGMLVLIDGNHRLEAYLSLANTRQSDFYVVETTHPSVIGRLGRIINTINGDPLSREERLHHALHMVHVDNMTVVSAAKLMKLPKSTVGHMVEAQDTRKRLDRFNFAEELPVKTLCTLYRIKQDRPLLEAARLIQEGRLNSDEAAELADRISKAAGSEKVQMAAIEELRRKYYDRFALKRKGQIGYRDAAAQRLKRALNVIEATKRESVEPIEESLRRKMRKAIQILESLAA